MGFARQEYWSGLLSPSPSNSLICVKLSSPKERKIWKRMVAAAAAKSLQSCPTLYNPIDGSPPGSSIPGNLQARTQEWVAISFSNAWKWKGKVKSLSCVWLLATPWTAAYQAPLSIKNGWIYSKSDVNYELTDARSLTNLKHTQKKPENYLSWSNGSKLVTRRKIFFKLSKSALSQLQKIIRNLQQLSQQ